MMRLPRLRTLLVLVGLCLLGLFVWFAGPFFAFADYHPLESELVRLIVIAIIVVAWVGSGVLARLRRMRLSHKLFAGVVKPAAQEVGPTSAEAIRLREKFQEAVATLSRAQGGKVSLYDRPWYVFIGAPGSGKTTALINSGLKFSLDAGRGRAVAGVGGTRNCEWLFTDEAVFLDTAGRYTTQDSDPDADHLAWKEFLGLLRKYRGRRPINGVILTVSAADLIGGTQARRDDYVLAARRRLVELQRELQITLPIYLMVTKCDLVSGFTEYFDDLSHEGRARVWGTTLPYDPTMPADATTRLGDELDALFVRLNERLFERLQAESDPKRRARIFGFPQQMAVLRGPLVDFATETFAATQFDQPVLFRGVYFTSGTQEGTPIDRLLSALGRRLAIAPEAMVPAGKQGKAYFVEGPIRDVLLIESGMAGLNRKLEMRLAAVQLGTYAALAAGALLGVVALTISLGRNSAYLADVSTAIETFSQVPAPPANAALPALLPRLDGVAAILEAASRQASSPPLMMRWGLFQGRTIVAAAEDAYTHELGATLVPFIGAHIGQRLVDYGAQPEKLYEYLKAYLMLGEPNHLNKEHLKFIADLEWRASGASAEAIASLTRHFDYLLQHEDRFPPVALNPTLVAQARGTIRQARIEQLVYNRLALTHPDDAPGALRLDIAGGVGADVLFRRRSGRRLSQPVPARFTADGFRQITSAGTDGLIKQFAADSWIWGGEGFSLKDSARLSTDVLNVYERDYIATWDGILDDIELAPFGGSQVADVLAALSAPTSPLRLLLQAIDTNTFLVKPADATPPTGTLASAQAQLGQIFARAKETVGLPTATPGVQVTTHFAGIHQLMLGAPGAAPVDRVLSTIGEIRKQLLSAGSGPGQVKPLDVIADAQLSGLIASLQQDAVSLPPAIRGLVSQLSGRTRSVVSSVATSDLESRYQDAIRRECTGVVDGRYPFAAGAADVPLDDFGRLFGYGGVFDRFFTTNLEKLVDTARSPWSWRPGSVGLSSAMLRQFEAAQAIREMFFRPGSQKPELHFTVSPTDLDVASTRFLLEIDGQNVEYRHGPERNIPLTWPGPNPGQAAISFEERGSARPNRTFDGPWAWFRLLDAVGGARRENDVRSTLRVELGGHTAQLRVEASSVRNPLASRVWRQFHCGI